MRRKCEWLLLCSLLALTGGCSGFAARRIAQAPNTYPSWLAPEAPVVLDFSAKLLTNSPKEYVDVGPPQARLCYRIVQPGDYGFKAALKKNPQTESSCIEFSFTANLPPKTNHWSSAPRGTVILLHGYGVAQFSMVPWAFDLAQEGWRCVLLDLRGHGKSTGKRIYFGTQETKDLSQLLDCLSERGELTEPVCAVGESYGAALALRWKCAEARLGPVVAMSPYPNLARATLNISNEYAPWIPDFWIKSGLKKLPSLLGVTPDQLNPESVLAHEHVKALFVAGGDDRIAPEEDVRKLWHLAAPGSEMVVVPNAKHEPLPYYFDTLADPVSHWLVHESQTIAAVPQKTDGSSD